MLMQVLETLARGGTRSFADLAGAMDVDEELLRQMIEHLVRMGYLRPISETCESGCRNCPVAGICALSGQGRAWGLTPKGSQIVQEMRQGRA